MDVNRAQQIVDSAETINVMLDGKSVWIDSVDSINNTVKVHPEHNPGQSQTVSVSHLQEA